jgi:hypothetical protein
MPYNGGMTELTLVLPFALPPDELAADLVRALKAPNLAALLSRSASFSRRGEDGFARSLPHERLLAQALGLADRADSADKRLPFAAAVMRGYGLEPGQDSWLIVHPAHIEIARTHLLMGDARRLGLVESHARALYDSARPYFDEDGHTLLYGDALTWFMRAGDWATLDTASPDATGGMNLTDSMPQGACALAYRKLQNEVQMLWHGHPANAEREARGLPAINGFWPWGAAAGAPTPAAAMTFASANAPPWMAALGPVVHGPFAHWLAAPARPPGFVDAALIGPALGGDWADWLVHMARIDSELLAPALAAVKGGLKLRLVLSHRSALVEARVSALSQRSFWRRHSLERLLG